MAVRRKRPAAPPADALGAVRPDGFPDAPPFVPSAWLGATLHERALDYARNLGDAHYPGALAWAAYSAARRAEHADRPVPLPGAPRWLSRSLADRLRPAPDEVG